MGATLKKENKFMMYLRTISDRNILLCIIINCLNYYGNKYTTAVRSMIGANEVGLDMTYIGLIISAMTFVAMFLRAPGGSLVDSLTKKITRLIAVTMVCRAIVWAFFGFVAGTASYTAVMVLDGALHAVMTIATPAMLAMTCPREVMGGIYAIFNGIQNISTGTARSVGLGFYKEQGAQTAMLVCAVFGIVAAVAAMLMDTSRYDFTAAPKPKIKGGKGLLRFYASGFHKQLLPFALLSCSPMLCFVMHNSFSQVWLQTTVFEHATIDSIGGSLNGVIGIFVGFLADFIPPTILAALLMFGVGVMFPLLTGIAETQLVYGIGLMCWYLFNNYGTLLRIICLTCVTKQEMGKVSSSIMFSYDIYPLLFNPILGWCVTKFAFQPTMIGVAVFEAICVVLYIIVSRAYLPKLKAMAAEVEAREKGEKALNAKV